jgi:membrane associated rhomboid family serine protease
MFGSADLVLVLLGASLIFNIAVVLQRRGRVALGFVALLVLDLALVVAALYASQRGLLFVLAVGGFAALVVAPAILGIGVRWAVSQGRYARAIRLLELRQLLQPGLGLERERQMLAGLALVTQGRGEEAIVVARRQLADEQTAGPLRRMILERLLTLLVIERRFDEASELFEDEGGLVLAGQAPGICVTMARAHGEAGRFDDATRCMAVLEQSPASLDPGLAPLVNGARVSYLAYLGRVDVVGPLLEVPGLLPGATPQRRRLWFGLAQARAGQDAEARRRWQSVVAEEEHDPQAAELARWRLSVEQPVLAPEPLEEAEANMAELCARRAAAYSGLPRAKGSLPRSAPITLALLASILAVHGALALFGGGAAEPLDTWLLLRHGANFPQLSLHGEAWRLPASMFLHVNLLHLLTNAIGLYMLGRFTEQVFGSWRLLVIYGLSGLAGALISAEVGAGLLSVGASGAIFGLLGAALVGLHGLRGQVPDGWRRQLTINLLIVIGLQVLIGLRFAVIDNAAHFGGLGGGLLVAWLLGPRQGEERASSPLSVSSARSKLAAVLSMLLIAGAAFVGWSVVEARERPLLARSPTKLVRYLGLEVTVPRHWYISDKRRGLALKDPLLRGTATLTLEAPQPLLRERPLWRVALELAQAQLAGQRRQPGHRDVKLVHEQPRSVGSQTLRMQLRVLDRAQLRHQLIYVRLQGRVLLQMHAELAPQRLRDYLPVLDRVAASVRLAAPTSRPADQRKVSSPGR